MWSGRWLRANVGRAIVATDDQRIFEAVNSAGYEAVMTGAITKSGTDRIAEVAATLPDAEIVVNVQGDEPLISASTIERAVDALIDDPRAGIVTTWEPMESAADVLNPDVVKIVVDDRGRAVYFSRSPVPYPRDAARAHGCLEAALRNDPVVTVSFPQAHRALRLSPRCVAGVHQLAAVGAGTAGVTGTIAGVGAWSEIKAIEASSRSIGVDTAEDLERVRSIVEEEACSLESKL